MNFLGVVCVALLCIRSLYGTWKVCNLAAPCRVIDMVDPRITNGSAVCENNISMTHGTASTTPTINGPCTYSVVERLEDYVTCIFKGRNSKRYIQFLQVFFMFTVGYHPAPLRLRLVVHSIINSLNVDTDYVNLFMNVDTAVCVSIIVLVVFVQADVENGGGFFSFGTRKSAKRNKKGQFTTD